jgi:threonine/homoserine/homoserine lactone efflux protein
MTWQERLNNLVDDIPTMVDTIRDLVYGHLLIAFYVAGTVAILFFVLWVRAARELRRLRRDFIGIRRVSDRMGGAWLR